MDSKKGLKDTAPVESSKLSVNVFTALENHGRRPVRSDDGAVSGLSSQSVLADDGSRTILPETAGDGLHLSYEGIVNTIVQLFRVRDSSLIKAARATYRSR